MTGEAQVGFALFDILPSRWTDKDGNQILLGTRQRSFDEGSEGAISIPLVITDETDDILPSANRFWQMRVCIDSEWEQYIFTVPAGDGPIDLTDVEVVEDPTTGIVYVPVPGPPGADGVDGTNGTDGQDGAPGIPGPVASVADVAPDDAGNVPLTADDIDALSKTGGSVTGDLDVTGAVTVTGDLSSTGTMTAGAGADITGDVAVTGDQSISGALSVDTSLMVDGRSVLLNSISVDTYLAGDVNGEFSSAHRGSGMLYPEHTLEAYRASLAEGAPAIEVSAQLTKDGVLVCFHDTTVLRMTGLSGGVADYTYAQLLNAVKVKAQTLLGSGWQDCNIPTVTQVLDELLGKCIIFLEPKTNDAVIPLQSLMDRIYPDAPNTVIWKLYYQNSTAWANDRGYKIWLYVDATTTQSQADPYELGPDQPTIWGVPHTASDAVIQAFVQRNASAKKVMVWEVHRRTEQLRFRNLGVKGFMSPQWSYLYNQKRAISSKFPLKVVTPGCMGVANYDPNYAIHFDANGRAYCDQFPNQSVMFGSFTPADPSATWTIEFGMVWDTVPGSTIHAGVAFARTDDSKYQFSTANAVGGYHVAVRGNGTLQIYRHDPGVTTGVKLAENLVVTQPVAGHVMTFVITVSPSTITFQRTDVADAAISANDTTYRGEYQHLSNGSTSTSATKPFFTYLNVP